MKKFTKILLPASAIASIGLVSSCSCSVSSDPTPIDKDYLKIENGILYGFKDEYKDKQLPESNYALVVPKEVTRIENDAFSDEDTDAKNQRKIVSVGFEHDSLCSNIGGASFMDCINLKKVVLPPLVTALANEIFAGCSQLTTIDISNVAGYIDSSTWSSPTVESWPKEGKIVCRADQEIVADSLLATINEETDNEWELDPQ